MRGSVAAKPGASVPKGRVSFTVTDAGTVTDFRAYGAEQCFVPAGSKQGGGVSSIPYFTNLEIKRVLPLEPAAKFPKRATLAFAPSPLPPTGTQSLRFTAPLTFSDPKTANGTIDALRNHPGGVAGTRCQLGFTFDARPGGEAVSDGSLPSYVDE